MFQVNKVEHLITLKLYNKHENNNKFNRYNCISLLVKYLIYKNYIFTDFYVQKFNILLLFA